MADDRLETLEGAGVFRRYRAAPEPGRVAAWTRATGWRFVEPENRELCVTWLWGADCAEHSDDDHDRPDDDAVGWPVWDHGRRVEWSDPRADWTARGFLLQPFWMDGQGAARLTAWCRGRGLRWAANGCSPYAPATTLAVMVQADERMRTLLPWTDGDPRVRG